MATGLRRHVYFLWVCSVLLVGFVLNLAWLNEMLNDPEPPLHQAWAFPAALMCLALAGCLLQHVLDWGRKNPGARGLETARLLFEVLVLGWLGFLFFADGFDLYMISVALGLALGVFAWGLLLRPLIKNALLKKSIRITDVVVMNLCVIVVGLELGMGVIGAVNPTPVLARSQQGIMEQIKTYRYPPHTVRYGFPCNSHGHYDTEFKPKQAGRPLILAIGDSFSTGIVPHYCHFTTVAERDLGGIDIYNMGAPSTEPPAYLHLWWTEGKELKPDLLIINIFVGNDIEGSWNADPGNPWLRSWLDRSQVSLFFVPERLQKIAAENERLASLGRKAGELQGEQGHPIMKNDVDALLAAFPWMADPTLEEAHLSKEEFMKIEAAHAFAVLLETRNDYYEAFFTVLSEIRWAVRGTPWMIMLIPDEFQVNDQLWKKMLAHMKRKVGEVDRFLPQRRINKWLEAQGIPCLDLLPALRAVPPLPDGQRHLYHLQDTHFNARGNHLTGKAMAKFIRKHFDHVLR